MPDAPDRLFHTAARTLSERFGAEMSRLYADHRDLFTALTAAGHPLPDELRVTAQLALARRLEADFVALAGRYDRKTISSALSIVAEAMEAGVDVDIEPVRVAATSAVEALTRRATASGAAADANAAASVLELARHAHVGVDVARAQEAVYRSVAAGAARNAAFNRMATALGIAPNAS